MHDLEEASYEQIIGGRYALYGPIASGGMATVHFGRQLGAAGFARTVAIKRLRGEFLESHEFISTLLDEARLASRIRHPNVVATLDMVTADDEVFLVMEYVAGESLSRLLNRLHTKRKRAAPKVATGILCGVLHALHAAHEATDERGDPMRIVHRDVSPQNVLVEVDGLARILDFGIAKGKGRLQTTRAGQLKGKVGYMAPEQILGEEPDRRSDVYAAAVVLWEVLTGRRLFPTHDNMGDNFNLIPKILEADIDPPSEVADSPRVLDGIVMRGLNRHRDARYDTAREFAVALEDSIGVATNRQIGEWVESVVATELAERARQVQELEAHGRGPDRRSAERIADATIKRRRRKRLQSSTDGMDSIDSEVTEAETIDPPTAVDDFDESPTAPHGIADPPTEIDDDHLDEDDDDDDEGLKETQVAMGRAAARARRAAMKAAERADGDEAQVRDEPSEEVTTAVYDADRLVPGPAASPKQDQTLASAVGGDEAVNDSAARPSDYRPGPSSSARASRDSELDELMVPVRSNRWFVIVVVVAAVVATVAAIVKMTSS